MDELLFRVFWKIISLFFVRKNIKKVLWFPIFLYKTNIWKKFWNASCGPKCSRPIGLQDSLIINSCPVSRKTGKQIPSALGTEELTDRPEFTWRCRKAKVRKEFAYSEKSCLTSSWLLDLPVIYTQTERQADLNKYI